MEILINILGIVVVLASLYLLSSSRKNIDIEIIVKSFLIQFTIAFLLVKFPLGQIGLQKISEFITVVLGYGKEGIHFLFGSLSDETQPTGSIFVISVLSNIIFVSALVEVLHYLGIIEFIVKSIGGTLSRFLRISKSESFVAIANMFLGQTEAPMLISKELYCMTESEIMLVLVSGMGSISATVFMGYVGMGIPMSYLLLSCALVPFGSIIVSKMLLPERVVLDEKEKLDYNFIEYESALNREFDSNSQKTKEITIDNNKDAYQNIIEAISQGANKGLQMVFGIGASILAIIGIVALVNGALGIFGLSLEQILSYLFAPLGFLMGIEQDKIFMASGLLGSKLVLNEFIAFSDLGKIINILDQRTAMILSISLAGFANISSMGICISGISVYCPEKRSMLSRLALRGMIGGFVVSILSALIVGLVMYL